MKFECHKFKFKLNLNFFLVLWRRQIFIFVTIWYIFNASVFISSQQLKQIAYNFMHAISRVVPRNPIYKLINYDEEFLTKTKIACFLMRIVD